MANIKSQIKRNRQNEKHRVRNRVFRGTARTAVKDARAAMETGKPKESRAAVWAAIGLLDKAAQKGVIHKNNAARRKSRLMKKFAKMGPVSVEAEVEPKIEEPVVEAKPKKEPARRRTTKKEPEVKAKPKVEAKPKTAPKKAEPKKTATTRKKSTAKKAA